MSESDQILNAFTIATDQLGAIPYFPKGEWERVAITEGLISFVRNGNELQWLVKTAAAHMREWRGLAEMRALYCTTFRPLDGIEGGSCSIAGYTPGDCEQSYIAAQKLLPPPAEIASEEDRLEAEKLKARLRELGRDVKIWSLPPKSSGAADAGRNHAGVREPS